jgi:protein-S-isoprenylcysteine O-methyltransferase Ste14
MRRTASIAGTGLFLVIAPGTAAGLVPWLICRWRIGPPFLGLGALRVLGGALIVAGAAAVLDSFARFALEGLGTPAPPFPPQKLVVGGLYRFVRNPMYVAAVSLILGQALLFASPPLLAYAAAAWLATHLFVRLYEEPKLTRTFGADYLAYCNAVPRWTPRLTLWRGDR